MLLFYLLFKSSLKVHRNKEKGTLGVKAQPRRQAQPSPSLPVQGPWRAADVFPPVGGGGEDHLVGGQLSPGPHCSQKGTTLRRDRREQLDAAR